MKSKITLMDVQTIQDLKESCSTIGEWKVKMKEKAVELNLTDQEILEISRGNYKV